VPFTEALTTVAPELTPVTVKFGAEAVTVAIEESVVVNDT